MISNLFFFQKKWRDFFPPRRMDATPLASYEFSKVLDNLIKVRKFQNDFSYIYILTIGRVMSYVALSRNKKYRPYACKSNAV